MYSAVLGSTVDTRSCVSLRRLEEVSHVLCVPVDIRPLLGSTVQASVLVAFRPISTSPVYLSAHGSVSGLPEAYKNMSSVDASV